MNENPTLAEIKKNLPKFQNQSEDESGYKILDPDTFKHERYINVGKYHAMNPLIYHRHAGYHPFVRIPRPTQVWAPLQQNIINPLETI